jgi:hypothetical protein
MQGPLVRGTALTLWVALALGLASSSALTQHTVTNLTSNQVGKAKHMEGLLQNAWGTAYAPGSGTKIMAGPAFTVAPEGRKACR